MKRELYGILCVLAISVGLQQECFSAPVNAFYQHYEAAQNFLSQGQYSSAIVEFRKSLRINYLDNSARIGLINSYLARATYYANQEKNYEKSANDFRSAIFYLKIYPYYSIILYKHSIQQKFKFFKYLFDFSGNICYNH